MTDYFLSQFVTSGFGLDCTRLAWKVLHSCWIHWKLDAVDTGENAAARPSGVYGENPDSKRDGERD